MQDTGWTMSGDTISYDKAKELARHQDPEVRAALARRKDVPAEILYFLAEDSSPQVRSSVAQNDATPGQASLLLARDGHAGVRSDLAGKIARVPTGKTRFSSQKPATATHTALRILATDLVPDVREVLADSIKDANHAPQDVIRTLATDSKLEVCGPVLEYSPLLDEDDLVDIIGSGYTQGALNFISRRKIVQESVSDAIAETHDISAITDLLSNHGAQIREKTLDDLVDQAENIELWHAPMCGRSDLTDIAAVHLAGFVSSELVETLNSRYPGSNDGNDQLVADLVMQQLGGTVEKFDMEASPPGSQGFLASDLPLANARSIYNKKGLPPEMVDRALQSQDYGFVLAALIVKGDCDELTARKIFLEKSAKGIVGLCVVAGIPPQIAVKIQQRMGRIAPADVIKPDGDTAIMSIDEAEWQIEFYAKLAGQNT